MSDRKDEDKKQKKNLIHKSSGDGPSDLVCSFCGRTSADVSQFVKSGDACICESCIYQSMDAIDPEEETEYPISNVNISDLDDEEFDRMIDAFSSNFAKQEKLALEAKREARRAEQAKTRLMSPKDIRKALDDYVIGQDIAKKTLAVAVYNHYKRLYSNFEDPDQDVELAKSNVLMLGPTGSGKTLLAQTLARILAVPFSLSDATALTEAGYVGEDVENILLRLIQNADYDIEEAERGIIYIDEIDKITRRSENPSITRDVSGEGVQQALLKIIEGTIVNVPPQGGRKHPHQDYIKIDTSNILFIVGGAFDGLDKRIKARVGKKSIGFGANIGGAQEDKINYLHQVTPEDLLSYGLIPEFIGRVPVVVSLDKLDEEALVSILEKPKNALIKQYQKLLKYDGVKLSFDQEAVKEIAKLAIKRDTGARGLRSIVEEIMLDIMYDVPSRKDVKEVKINKKVVEKKEEAKYILAK